MKISATAAMDHERRIGQLLKVGFLHFQPDLYDLVVAPPSSLTSAASLRELLAPLSADQLQDLVGYMGLSTPVDDPVATLCEYMTPPVDLVDRIRKASVYPTEQVPPDQPLTGNYLVDSFHQVMRDAATAMHDLLPTSLAMSVTAVHVNKSLLRNTTVVEVTVEYPGARVGDTVFLSNPESGAVRGAEVLSRTTTGYTLELDEYLDMSRFLHTGTSATRVLRGIAQCLGQEPPVVDWKAPVPDTSTEYSYAFTSGQLQVLGSTTRLTRVDAIPRSGRATVAAQLAMDWLPNRTVILTRDTPRVLETLTHMGVPDRHVTGMDTSSAVQSLLQYRAAALQEFASHVPSECQALVTSSCEAAVQYGTIHGMEVQALEECMAMEVLHRDQDRGLYMLLKHAKVLVCTVDEWLAGVSFPADNVIVLEPVTGIQEHLCLVLPHPCTRAVVFGGPGGLPMHQPVVPYHGLWQGLYPWLESATVSAIHGMHYDYQLVVTSSSLVDQAEYTVALYIYLHTMGHQHVALLADSDAHLALLRDILEYRCPETPATGLIPEFQGPGIALVSLTQAPSMDWRALVCRSQALYIFTQDPSHAPATLLPLLQARPTDLHLAPPLGAVHSATQLSQATTF